MRKEEEELNNFLQIRFQYTWEFLQLFPVFNIRFGTCPDCIYNHFTIYLGWVCYVLTFQWTWK